MNISFAFTYSPRKKPRPLCYFRDMSDYTIYHNPRCRKSREALAYLRENDIEPTIRLYLKEVPDKEEFDLLLSKLNLRPSDLLRRGEMIFKERFKGKEFNEDEWMDILMEHPKLIERPIVVKDNRALIGRPLSEVERLVAGKFKTPV